MQTGIMQTEEKDVEEEKEEEAHKEEGENVSLPHAQEVCPFHGESKQLLVPCIVGTTALRFDTRGNRGARNTANKNRGMR